MTGVLLVFLPGQFVLLQFLLALLRAEHLVVVVTELRDLMHETLGLLGGDPQFHMEETCRVKLPVGLV